MREVRASFTVAEAAGQEVADENAERRRDHRKSDRHARERRGTIDGCRVDVSASRPAEEENDVIVGSDNANGPHCETDVMALARADRTWLSRLITRRVPLHGRRDGFVRQRGDVEAALEFHVSP